MKFARVRTIIIDVVPSGAPVLDVRIEKVHTRADGSIEQVIGDFDRMYKRLHDVPALDARGAGDDGLIDAFELYQIIAHVVLTWINEKHGGRIDGARVILEG